MEPSEYIHLPRKPRLGLDRPSYGLKIIALLIVGAAVMTGLIYFGMKSHAGY